MLTCPRNLILIWPGTHAETQIGGVAYLAGWRRETTLDGLFLKGWGDDVGNEPNTTGGNATHTHTSPAHFHVLLSHSHTYTLSDVGDDYGAGYRAEAGNDNREHNHGHGTSTSGERNGGQTTSDAVTYSAISNDPPNRRVIFIKANAGARIINNICGFWGESDTPPDNWTKVTECADRYLKGAPAGADADLVTDNGSYYNAHTYNHTHTAQSHTHNAANSVTSGTQGRRSGGSTSSVGNYHVHSVSLKAGTQALNSYSATPATQTEVVEPAYRRLHLIKRGTNGLKKKGLIGMWLGGTAAGQFPAGWSLYTAMKDRHVKVGNPVTSPTGGSNTHTHGSQSHAHTGSGTHTHTADNTDAHSNSGEYYAGNQQEGVLIGNRGHVHIVQNISSVTANYDNASVTADSSNNEPEYRRVAFIKFEKEIGAAMLCAFL